MHHLEKKRVPFIMLMVLLCVLMNGCAQRLPPEPLSETRLLLDTVCTITIYDADADQELLGQVLDLCAEYEAMLSRTAEGSDIWRINHGEGEPVLVEPQTVEVIRTALAYSDFSGGIFDITIGQVSSLWDFNGSPAVPSATALKAARDTVDYRQVTVEEHTVKIADAKAWLDLGCIAKGYIADQLAGFLKERGVSGAVIDLGGNIVTVGTKPDGSPWRIGVKMPFGGRSEVIGILSTSEASVVTSGIYERQFVENGVLYHHILDPATGMPVKSDVVSTTVVTESSTTGDALSTIILLAGSEKAMALFENVPGLMGAVMILESGEMLQYGEIDFTSVN